MIMQMEDGRMVMLENNSELQKKMQQLLNSMPESDVPVVKVGDVFKIRDCHFELTEITEDGIKAKGIRRGEFIQKKLKV
jgi:hypothetical protein